MAMTPLKTGTILAVASLLSLAGLADAQTKPAAKKPPAAAKPAAAKPAAAKPGADKPGDKATEPATVEAAAKVLDLRTVALPPGAKPGGLPRTLGMLMYEAKTSPKAALEFHRQDLLKRGFKELPGGYSAETTETADFTKAGFRLRTSASAAGDGDKAGWSSVTLVNDGNVALDKLPVPPGVKPFPFGSAEAAYTTTAKVAETSEACRKLLLAAGWEPYGRADTNATNADSQMLYFKRNAIHLQSWVSTTPAAGGKTLVRYSTELFQADLPVPPLVEDPEYTDSLKRLTYDLPTDQTDAVIAFYQERLPKQGWTATTEKPVSDDRTKKQFLIYRNAAKDLLSLDLTQFTDIVRVELKHQSAAEVAEEEKRFKEQAEIAKAEAARKNRKVELAVPLPAGAEKLKKAGANEFEFSLPTGSGAKTLTAFRDHFAKSGWKEEQGTDLDETIGHLRMTKEDVTITLSYFDLGIGDVDVKLSGPKNVAFDPQASKEKPPAAAKPAKKARPAIPGLPDLPEGVELPDDVNELLKKALKEAEAAKPPAVKKPLPKK
jgi:hypothetical protein